MIKKIGVFIVAFLFISSSAIAEQGKGSISGKINYCDNDVVSGMQVFIPGRPHVVITGADGQFMLSNVPAGEYKLNFMKYGKVIRFSQLAKVEPGQDTAFKQLEFCDDGNQVISASYRKSDTTNSFIPEEKVLFRIPDCSNVSDGSSFLINNGKGRCQNGKVVVYSCNTHYSDCDKKPSNGCEVDTHTDMMHCGGCFNECADLESCDIGIC